MLQLRIALRPCVTAATINPRSQNLGFHESPASYPQLDLDMFRHRTLLSGYMRTRNPATALDKLASEVMIASRPPCFRNRNTDSTLGPMLPGGKWLASANSCNSRGATECSALCVGFL